MKKVTTTLNLKPHLFLISPSLFQRKEPHCSAQTHDAEDGSSWGPSLNTSLGGVPAPLTARVPSCPELSHCSSVCLGQLPGWAAHPRWYRDGLSLPCCVTPGKWFSLSRLPTTKIKMGLIMLARPKELTARRMRALKEKT